jgi:hypothetical protein
VAVNVALFKPAPIFTVAGTVTLVLLLSSVTLTALEAAAVRVIVQLAAPGELTVPGAQLTLLS